MLLEITSAVLFWLYIHVAKLILESTGMRKVRNYFNMLLPSAVQLLELERLVNNRSQGKTQNMAFVGIGFGADFLDSFFARPEDVIFLVVSCPESPASTVQHRICFAFLAFSHKVEVIL